MMNRGVRHRLLLLAASGTFLAAALGSFWVVKRTTPRRQDSWIGSYLSDRSFKTLQDRYLELLKAQLIRLDFDEADDPIAIIEGRKHAGSAETMIGLKRLDHLDTCIRDVLRSNVPGDFIEAGAWRGGATIFMRAALVAAGDSERAVWVADSFQGLPKPNTDFFPADKYAWFLILLHPELPVSLGEVKQNFARYGLLDERVKFLPGWFKDTLPNAPIESLAILRIDADLYESTWQALTYLYPKVSSGGYVIIDDYNLVYCKQAVDDFRVAKGIRGQLKPVDWTAVYWQKD